MDPQPQQTSFCPRRRGARGVPPRPSAPRSSPKLKSGMRLKGTVSSIGGLRRLRGSGRHRRPHPHLRALLEPRQPPLRGRQVGLEVEVEVLDVDLNRERISLGLKQTTEDPVACTRQEVPRGRYRRGHRHQARAVRRGSSTSVRASRASCTSPRWANKHVDQPSQGHPCGRQGSRSRSWRSTSTVVASASR